MPSAPKHYEGDSRPDGARLAVSLSRQFEAGSQPERSAPKHYEGDSRPDGARLAVSLSRRFEAGSQPERCAESPFAKKTIGAGASPPITAS
jgi:hypothetical protein